MITVSDLTVTFGRGRRAVPAVQHVSFTVEAGGFTVSSVSRDPASPRS